MFTLNQALSSIVAVDLGAKDTSHGDLLAFGTAFTSDDDVLASTDAEPYSALTIEHALPYLTLPYLTLLPWMLVLKACRLVMFWHLMLRSLRQRARQVN